MRHRSSPNETRQDPMVLAPSMSSACLLPVENFSQRESFGEMRTFKIVNRRQIIIMHSLSIVKGFPGGASGQEPACQCRRHNRCRFNPWVRKIFWRRKWQPTPVFLPRESPWTKELGGPKSTDSQRMGND